MSTDFYDIGPRPHYHSIVRPCDDPRANFERLRGRWTNEKPAKREYVNPELALNRKRQERRDRARAEQFPDEIHETRKGGDVEMEPMIRQHLIRPEIPVKSRGELPTAYVPISAEEA